MNLDFWSQCKKKLEKVEVLDREPRYFERGVKEAIYIRANELSLNKDGGRYKLPKVYDPLIDRHVIKVKTGQSADESCRVDSWKFWR